MAIILKTSCNCCGKILDKKSKADTFVHMDVHAYHSIPTMDSKGYSITIEPTDIDLCEECYNKISGKNR